MSQLSLCAARKFKHRAVDEFELIRKYFVRPDEAPGVITGIGDDGAILQTDPDRDLVTVIDTLVAGVHFPDDTDAFDVGFRSVAVNLSDIAAMGARPRWMTLALTLSDADESWIDRFAAGLHAAAAEHNVALVGGDMTRGPRIIVSVQITGDVAAGCALRRSGARIGDTIFVTGTMGDAAAGLDLILSGTPNDRLSARFLRPTVRVDFGQSLATFASAAIDVSDGLFADLQKMLIASGVGGVIELELLPLSADLRSTFDVAAQRRFALSGGDDYELCFTAHAGDVPDASDLQVTAIGTVTSGEQLVCHVKGNVVDFDDSGYRHFQ